MAQSAASNDTCIRPIRSYVVDPPTDLLRSHLAGREVDLGGLQAAFHDRNDAIPSRAAVWGVPGLGKTQLALKYASESAHCYSHIFWISAATAGKILEGYDTILDLLESPERFASEQHLRLAAVKRWLEDEDGEEPRTWLLVFDNATGGTVSTLREVLPTRNSRGKILFTARSEAVARALTSIDGGEHYCKELSSLSVTEASSVLCRSAGIRPDTSIVLEPSVELAKLLGLLPLAIDQAASIIKQSRFGVESLLRIFSDRLLKWKVELPIFSVGVTFAMVFADLQISSPEIGNLFRLLSFFDVEGIPTDILIEGTRSLVLAPESICPLRLEHDRSDDSTGHTSKSERDTIQDLSIEVIDLQNLFQLIQSPKKLQLACERLQALALLVIRGDAKWSFLWIHDQNQYLIQHSTETQAEPMFWAKQAGRVIANAFAQVSDPESSISWPQCELYFRHVIAIAAHAENFQIDSVEIFEALERCSRYLLSRGRYEDAEKLCVQALAGIKKLLSEDDLHTLSVVTTMAWVVYRRGKQKLSEAVALFDRALRGRVKQLGLHHRDTLAAQNDLGFIYEKQGIYDLAELCLTVAMEGLEKQLGPNHRLTCSTKRNFGFLKFKQGDLAQAETYSLQALVGERESLGNEHPETITTATNLALIYEKQGKYSKAEELTLGSLEARQKTLGAEHPSTLVSANNLASIFEKQGKYDEAKLHYSKVLACRERILGSGHPRTHLTVQNLALLYERMGRLRESETLCNRALAGKMNHLGPKNPETLMSQARLASVYEEQARYTEAERLCQEILAREHRLKSKHPTMLTASQVLAKVYMGQEKLTESETLYRSTFARMEQALGIHNIETLSTLRNMGALFVKLVYYREARECCVRAMEGCTKSLGPSHPETLLCVEAARWFGDVQFVPKEELDRTVESEDIRN